MGPGCHGEDDLAAMDLHSLILIPSILCLYEGGVMWLVQHTQN